MRERQTGARKGKPGARGRDDATKVIVRDSTAALPALQTGEPRGTSMPPPIRPDPPDRNKTIVDPSVTPDDHRVVAVLVGIHGALKNRVYPIANGDNPLGRRTADDNPGGLFDPDDGKISRSHGSLDYIDGRLLLRANKEIRLNGASLDRDGELVAHGDEIALGASRFMLAIVPTRRD